MRRGQDAMHVERIVSYLAGKELRLARWSLMLERVREGGRCIRYIYIKVYIHML